MPSTTLLFKEGEVVKLVLEFLENRALNISMLSLEREAGLINGVYSDDILFLRQLILDGQWDDIIDFIQPLDTVDAFNMKHFKYIVYRHKYLELLCIKSENGPMSNHEFTVDEVVKCLNTLESLCPSKEDYSNLCLLLTLPRLSDHVEYQNWNPSNARVECFKDIFPLVENFLSVNNQDGHVSKSDRLVQLIIKGILYESCVEFCQHKATSNEYDCKDLKVANILSGNGFSDADLSLLSWLQAVPHATFACPFEQRMLNVDIRPLVKPSLEASWSDQILVTPIKPKVFPHSAIPSSRPLAAELMSRSLNPQYDGLSYGLCRKESLGSMSGDASLMSRSFAGFRLNPVNKVDLMQSSVDKLFHDSDKLDTRSSAVSVLRDQASRHQSTPHSTSIPTAGLAQNQYRPVKSSSPRQSVTAPIREDKTLNPIPELQKSSELYKEYRKQRQKLQEQMEEQENKRLLYQEQLQDLEKKSLSFDDNRLVDSGVAVFGVGKPGNSKHGKFAF